jgi:DNA (cytosine-5)-methyltransferase 1
MLPSAVAQLLPTPTARLGDSRGAGDPEVRRARNKFHTPELDELGAHVLAQDWGIYTAAIRRQESFRSPAPSPTEPNTKGNPRLSARFVEWMMGVPIGYVTDILGRNQALRCLGNGVVVDQAVAAFDWLLSLDLAEVS